MTSSDDDALAVWLGDQLVGRLMRHSEGSSFSFTDEYLALPGRPVLGQYFEEAPERVHRVRYGTPRWFSNLLPEGRLRQLIAQRAGVHERRSYQLLELMGLDLPGAVTVRREGAPPGAPPDDSDDPAEPNAEQLLKFSLAGVQLKFSGNVEGRGLTIPAHGRGGDWIVKLPDERYPGVPENEFSMMSWAAAAGLDVPAVQLVPTGAITGLPSGVFVAGEHAFAVRRFDRPEVGRRVHTEDLAQVLDRAPDTKYRQTSYDHIAKVLAALSPDDIDEYVRRLVFLVLSGNGDAHLKNWSLIYPDGVTAQLAPAYDLLSTVAYMEGDALGLALARTKQFDQVTLERFRRFAGRAGIDDGRVVDTVHAQVDRTIDAWQLLREELPALPAVRAGIDRRLVELPLVRF